MKESYIEVNVKIVGWGLQTSGPLLPTAHEEQLAFREAEGKEITIVFSGAWNKVFVLMRTEDGD
jgi:hypothetical protein